MTYPNDDNGRSILAHAVASANFTDADAVTEHLWQYILAFARRPETHPGKTPKRILAFRRRVWGPVLSCGTTAQRLHTACLARILGALKHEEAAIATANDRTRLDHLCGRVMPAAWTADHMQEEAEDELHGDGSGVFRCFQCQKWHTTYYQQQTRSGDEAMTIFIHCHYCGRSWTQ